MGLMSNPTKSEKTYWDKLAEIVGCIACRLDGRINHNVSIHHVDGRTKPGCHMQVLPLCAPHHQTGGMYAPSVHPWKRRFEQQYGTQESLMLICGEILKGRKI
jgi:hypothetical protein